MILPIGHEERTVRRLPWVTLALMLLCIGTFLLGDTGDPGALDPDGASERFEEAADYWRQRAYLDAPREIREHVAYDVMPNQRPQYLATLPDLSPFTPQSDAERTAQQDELDRLVLLSQGAEPEEASSQTYFERWGLVPTSPRPRSFLTHMFVHAGWLHLLGNLFLLFLAGPAIEDRWGRAGFAAFYLLSGLFAAGFYLALSGTSGVPMVGASGAIAGVLGAFAVRLWRTKIRLAYFFLVLFRPYYGTFEAPAWAMLSLWFGNELFQATISHSLGLQSGIAYWAHVGGFAFGAAAAAGLRATGIEERFIDPGIEAQRTKFAASPVLEEAMAARERGEVGEALALLRAEWQRQPDEAIALACWDAALACAQPELAADALTAAVQSAASRGELELALRHWSELTDHVPGARIEPATLLRFAPMLIAENQRERAALALRQAVDPAAPATPGQALRVVELARELDPPTAVRAARRALASPDLHEAKRAKLAALVEELGDRAELSEFAAGGEAPPEPESPRPSLELPDDEPSLELAPHEPVPAGLAEDDRAIDLPAEDAPIDDAPIAVAAASEPPPGPEEDTLPDLPWDEHEEIELARFARAKLIEARPLALGDGGLRLRLEEGREAQVEWSRIQAVAVAIVAGLAPKPVLVIDLLANWNEAQAEALRGVRLRSDRFDPRALLGSGGDAKSAFATLVGALLERSGAQPLPSAEHAAGAPFARYESLEDYQRIALEVAE